MANIVYNNFLKQLMSGTIDLVTDNIYAMLVSGTYTPSVLHSGMTSILAHQSCDTLSSYKSGGSLLTSKTLLEGSNSVAFDAADVSWTTATVTASGVVVWHSGSDTLRNNIAWIELGNQSSTNGTFQIVWNNTNGIFKISGT